MIHIQKIEKDCRAAAVETVNGMLDYINRAAPEILALLEGRTIGKSTGRPPKKITDQIDAITAAAPCRSFVHYSVYSGGASVWLETDCYFKDGPGGYGYDKRSAALAEALERAGVRLPWPLSGTGENERAMRDVCASAGFKKVTILAAHG